MANPLAIRAQIEDELVARLTPLKASIGVQSVSVYNGEVNAEALDDMKRVCGGKTPAIFVCTTSCAMRQLQNRRGWYVQEQDIEIFVLSSNLRSREDNARRGAVYGDPGAYIIIENIHPLIIGQVSVIDSVGMYDATRGETIVEHRPDLSVWKLGYQVPIDVLPVRLSADDLLSIKVDLNFPAPEMDTSDNPVVEEITEVGG